MKFTMRIYKRHDMDLLLLHKTKGFSMQKAVKAALRMHLGLSEVTPIPFPACSEDVSKFYSSSQFHLSLSEEKEDDLAIIKFLNEIPRGLRNSFCKNLTRYYLTQPKQFMYSNNKIFL